MRGGSGPRAPKLGALRLAHVTAGDAEALEGLRGATIDPRQLAELAGVLAQHLGIRVEE